MKPVITGVFLLAVLAGMPVAVAAAGYDDYRLSFLAGYGLEFEPELAHGPVLAARADLRLGTMTSISISGAGGWHGLGPGPASNLALLAAGLRLDLDMFEFVPLACLEMGWLMVDREQVAPAYGLGLQVTLGLEYLFSESLFMVTQIQYQVLLSAPDLLPGGLVFSLGVGWHHW